MTIMKKNEEEIWENETTDSDSTTIGEGKGVNYERGGTDFDLIWIWCAHLFRWQVYGIFDKEGEIVTEGSIFWVNTDKTIWELRVIKIPFSDFLEDAKHLKLIWINTKKEDRFWLDTVLKNTNTKVFLYQLKYKSM